MNRPYFKASFDNHTAEMLFKNATLYTIVA